MTCFKLWDKTNQQPGRLCDKKECRDTVCNEITERRRGMETGTISSVSRQSVYCGLVHSEPLKVLRLDLLWWRVTVTQKVKCENVGMDEKCSSYKKWVPYLLKCWTFYMLGVRAFHFSLTIRVRSSVSCMSIVLFLAADSCAAVNVDVLVYKSALQKSFPWYDWVATFNVNVKVTRFECSKILFVKWVGPLARVPCKFAFRTPFSLPYFLHTEMLVLQGQGRVIQASKIIYPMRSELLKLFSPRIAHLADWLLSKKIKNKKIKILVCQESAIMSQNNL